MADISITAANVKPGTGYQRVGIYLAGEAITAGQPVYLFSSTTVKKAQCDVDDTQVVAIGIAMQSVSTGQSVEVGSRRITIATSGLTVGTLIVVSAAAGAIAPVADLASTNRVFQLGAVVSATDIDVIPYNWAVAIA